MEENRIVSLVLFIAVPVVVHVILGIVSRGNKRVLMCGMAVMLISLFAMFWMKELEKMKEAASTSEPCSVQYHEDVPVAERGETECENKATEDVRLNGQITKYGVIVGDLVATVVAVVFLVIGKREDEMRLSRASAGKDGEIAKEMRRERKSGRKSAKGKRTRK